MTNGNMKARMEALKLLLETSAELVNNLENPTKELLFERAHHIKALEHIFYVESNLYSKNVPLKERDPEVFALAGFIDLHIKEILATLTKHADRIQEEEKAKAAATTSNINPDHPLAPIIEEMAKKGMDVKVFEMAMNKDDKCKDENCPVHGKNGILSGMKKDSPEGNN